MIYRFILFLALNFGALAIGGLFTSKGVPSDWYQSLTKAPWTPPGWVFGFAWTTIMICFSIYMTAAWKAVNNKKLLLTLYSIQWILNVGWNPTFFYFHQVLPALIIIVALTVVVGCFLFYYRRSTKKWSVLMLPYFIWLLIATSLNGYVLFNN